MHVGGFKYNIQQVHNNSQQPKTTAANSSFFTT
jgi:hypothetical protein